MRSIWQPRACHGFEPLPLIGRSSTGPTGLPLRSTLHFALKKRLLKPAVLHFCGKKTHIFMRSARAATMNHFRLQYLLQIEGLPRWKALWRLVLEDIQYIFWPKGKQQVFWKWTKGKQVFWAKWARAKRAPRKLMRLMKIKGDHI